jgi:tRNA-dihydrouridine synthase A
MKMSSDIIEKTLHIAPMLNYSTREFRQLMRILSKRIVLWTEMVVDDTIQNAKNLDEHLAYHPDQHPIVCQIGGNSPFLCGEATKVVEMYGYDAIDFNIDCPSERVSGEREFGAVLLTKVKTAKAVLASMKENVVDIPISIKTRVGVDDLDDIEFITEFIHEMLPVCTRFVIHARKCVLCGLMNARQNRTIPPLNYPRVYELCRRFPQCEFWINGGIQSLKDAKMISYGINTVSDDVQHSCCTSETQIVDENHSVPCNICVSNNGSCTAPPLIAPDNLKGCMIGRAAIENPCIFWNADSYFYGEEKNPCKNRREVLDKYCEYLERTYPRRCCDNDTRKTFQYPSPKISFLYDSCHLCQDVYGGQNVNQDRKLKDINEFESKISAKIIGRALKPVQGIFSGCPKSRLFRRTCDSLGQNVSLRDCGPGYILRKAIESMPDYIIDEDFTE